jgi:hypothetical protein
LVPDKKFLPFHSKKIKGKQKRAICDVLLFSIKGNGGGRTERRILASREDLLGSQTQRTTVVSVLDVPEKHPSVVGCSR